MKTSAKRKKTDFSVYPQILIRADQNNKAWFERRRNLADLTANELLTELRTQDERRECANAAKRKARSK